ncbi:MAG: hypothetical protein ABW212_00510, partial [Pseudonocardia sediminis]
MTTDPRTPRPPDDPVPGPPPDPPTPPDPPAPPDSPGPPDCPAPDPLAPDDRADLDRLDGLRGPTDLAELVGAEAALGAVVRVSGTGDLVASLPVLIGFHPR